MPCPLRDHAYLRETRRQAGLLNKSASEYLKSCVLGPGPRRRMPLRTLVAMTVMAQERGATKAKAPALSGSRAFLFSVEMYVDRILVRSSGFEPPRYCYRQPLKLVRLPVPPRPRTHTSIAQYQLSACFTSGSISTDARAFLTIGLEIRSGLYMMTCFLILDRTLNPNEASGSPSECKIRNKR